jgi:hypothetical protein
MVLGRASALASLLLLASCSPAAGSKSQDTAGRSVVVSFTGNLDARAKVPEEPFSVEYPEKTSQLGAVVEVRGEGGRYPLSFYFRKEDTSAFAFYVLADLEDGAPEIEPDPVETLVGQGTLHFDTDGLLLSVVPSEPIELHFRGAPRSQLISLNFGSAKDQGGDGRSGFTQYALSTTITYQASH